MSLETTSARWILSQLDSSAENFTFPDLGHGYFFAIEARLHGFADASRWALSVEAVGYNPRAGDVLDVLHTHGNCLTTGEPGFVNEDFLGRIDNFAETEDATEPETWTGSDIVVRGHRISLDGQPGDELSAVFRRLVPAHRDPLLADAAELRRRIPADLPEILRLEQWHQPDLFATKPSMSQAFAQVAEALAANDPSLYRPTEEPNTQWTNWPDSGSL